jgi:hypothetical protein
MRCPERNGPVANRSGNWQLVLVMVLGGLVEAPRAQEVLITEGRGSQSAVENPGIRTDRLKPKQLRIWRNIEWIVLAQDGAGQPLHPRLESLWNQAQSGGHTIYIEMTASTVENMAGKFLVEKLDPEGKNHILLIHLNLSAINRAVTGKWARRADGFIPFENLGMTERYAEVLAHELAHVVLTLKDPSYASLSDEQDRLTAELVSSRNPKAKKLLLYPENRQRMIRLESLEKLIEGPPNAAEIEVWRELVKSQSVRSSLGPQATICVRLSIAKKLTLLDSHTGNRQIPWKLKR